MEINWKKLYFGHVLRAEVAEAVKDKEWQATRRYMKGKSMPEKFRVLNTYVQLKREARLSDDEWRKVEVRSTNYVTALARGGLLVEKDYR